MVDSDTLELEAKLFHVSKDMVKKRFNDLVNYHSKWRDYFRDAMNHPWWPVVEVPPPPERGY